MKSERDRSALVAVGLLFIIGWIIINPSPDELLSKSYKIFVLGTLSQINSMKKLLSSG